MPLLRFQRCLAAFLFPPFGSYLAKKAENKSSQDFLSPTVSTYLHGEQRGRGLETRPAPLHRHAEPPATTTTQTTTQTATPTPPLATLAVCLRSPCSEGANRSPRYARRTICPFFAFSGVWQLFVFCLLVRSSLKGRKRKAAKIICRLRSPHTCMASRGAEASKLGPPLYIAMQNSPCFFDNRFYIIVSADNNDYRLFPPFPPCPPSSSHPLFLSSWWAPASYFGSAHQHRQADPHPPP